MSATNYHFKVIIVLFMGDVNRVIFLAARIATGCPAPPAGERMERYLVLYGVDPGGPFVNTSNPVVVPHNPLLGPTGIVPVDELLPSTDYSVIVLPEDQARNVDPAAFDPTLDLPPLPLGRYRSRSPHAAAGRALLRPCDRGGDLAQRPAVPMPVRDRDDDRLRVLNRCGRASFRYPVFQSCGRTGGIEDLAPEEENDRSAARV
jgi:hypothetical protein